MLVKSPFFWQPQQPQPRTHRTRPGALAVHKVNVRPCAAARPTFRMTSQAPAKIARENVVKSTINGALDGT